MMKGLGDAKEAKQPLAQAHPYRQVSPKWIEIRLSQWTYCINAGPSLCSVEGTFRGGNYFWSVLLRGKIIVWDLNYIFPREF
jgi:hypothetical protein